jgi:hypothetical protein
MCLRRLEPPQPPAGVGEQVVDRSTCHDGIVRPRVNSRAGASSYIRTATPPAIPWQPVRSGDAT